MTENHESTPLKEQQIADTSPHQPASFERKVIALLWSVLVVAVLTLAVVSTGLIMSAVQASQATNEQKAAECSKYDPTEDAYWLCIG